MMQEVLSVTGPVSWQQSQGAAPRDHSSEDGVLSPRGPPPGPARTATCHRLPSRPQQSGQGRAGSHAPGTFDVSVDLPFRVEVVQALEDLPQDGGDVGLLQRARLQLQTDRQTDRASGAPTTPPGTPHQGLSVTLHQGRDRPADGGASRSVDAFRNKAFRMGGRGLWGGSCKNKCDHQVTGAGGPAPRAPHRPAEARDPSAPTRGRK